MAAKTATAALDAAARTSDRRDGAGYSPSPKLWWGLGKNVGLQPARVLPSTSNSPLTMAGRGWGAAGGIARAGAAGTGSAAHRGAHRRRLSSCRFSICLCRRWGTNWWEVLKMHDTMTLELVIAVPKISCPPRPLRAVLSEPQMVERLGEVPTVVSPFLQFVKQNADIPVPGARGVLGNGGLQGFFPEQSSHPFDEQTIERSSSRAWGFRQWRSSRFSPKTRFVAVDC